MQIPEKFQNKDGTLNSDALLKSYSELEKKIGTMITLPGEDADEESRQKFQRALGVPANASEYPDHELFGSDEELKKKFLDAGLSKKQAEKILALAEEYFTPALSEIFRARHESDSFNELEKFFGGKEKMQNIFSEINSFAEKFLPEETFSSLSGSAEGIKSIYRMMQSMEPSVKTSAMPEAAVSEASLRDMMRNPKYWREKNPGYIRKIESGFKKLYA